MVSTAYHLVQLLRERVSTEIFNHSKQIHISLFSTDNRKEKHSVNLILYFFESLE